MDLGNFSNTYSSSGKRGDARSSRRARAVRDSIGIVAALPYSSSVSMACPLFVPGTGDIEIANGEAALPRFNR